MNQKGLIARLLNLKKLLFSLLIILLASIGLHRWLNWDGFFLNLAAEVIGIAVTVGYVESILEKLKSEEWKIPLTRVTSRIQLFVDRSINACLQSLRYDYKTLDKAKIIGLSNDELKASIHTEIVRAAREILMVEALLKIDAFNGDDWKNFGMHMQSICLSAERLLLAFNDRLSPEQYTLLLDIQEIAEGTGFAWSTVPYIANDPEQIVKGEFSERTVFDLRNLLQMLEELYATAA